RSHHEAPPLSGSSLMPLDNQVDQATGIAEFSVPHTTIMAATPQSEWPTTSSPIVTAANAIGRPHRSEKRCRPTKALAPYVPANPASPNPNNRRDSCGRLTCVYLSRNGRRYVKPANTPA